MIRRARIPDAREIHKLLLFYAQDGQLLGRSLADIYDAIRDFYVYEETELSWELAPLPFVGKTWPKFVRWLLPKDSTEKGSVAKLLRPAWRKLVSSRLEGFSH